LFSFDQSPWLLYARGNVDTSHIPKTRFIV